MQTQVTTSSFSLRHGWLVRAAGALLAIGAISALPTQAQAQVGVYVSVNIAPPILPVYAQPMIPGPGYIWTPGYWAWGGDGYYWVPGTWVLPPYMGALWTPGYWGWNGGVYLFHRGYWGRHVGFYGGIDYGYGYSGRGYEGGYWRNNRFYYNRSVNHVGGNIRNVYNRTVIHDTTINRRASFNGGRGGISARPTAQERSWDREQHHGPVTAQLQQRTLASRTPSLRAAVNHGAPPIAATARAGAFHGQDRVAARGAPAAMSVSAVRDEHAAPHSANSRNDRALRSASFAPHADRSMPSGNAGRYTPAVREQERAPRDSNRAAPREAQARAARGSEYQPQAARPARYQAQAPREMRNNARGNYRTPNERPAQAHAAAAHSHPAARAEQRKRGDDKQHR